MTPLSTFTRNLIDYAGLFPPASLSMQATVANYAQYRAGPHRDMLGNLLLPYERLAEFRQAASTHIESSSDSWPLSIIAATDAAATIPEIDNFSPTGAAITSVELKISDRSQLDALPRLAGGAGVFIEFPLDSNFDTWVEHIGRRGFNAKIRTGGITKEAFPTADQIIAFLMACRDFKVAFKATAGLHHLTCGTYPLTYERDAAKGEMFGFLNLFFAAIFLFEGGDEKTACTILLEKAPTAFRVTDSGISWRDVTLSENLITTGREMFALSYGSCSFDEPVAELNTLRARAA